MQSTRRSKVFEINHIMMQAQMTHELGRHIPRISGLSTRLTPCRCLRREVDGRAVQAKCAIVYPMNAPFTRDPGIDGARTLRLAVLDNGTFKRRDQELSHQPASYHIIGTNSLDSSTPTIMKWHRCLSRCPAGQDISQSVQISNAAAVLRMNDNEAHRQDKTTRAFSWAVLTTLVIVASWLKVTRRKKLSLAGYHTIWRLQRTDYTAIYAPLATPLSFPKTSLNGR